MRASIWVSMVFIVLTVLTMSLSTLLFKKAIIGSKLPEDDRFDLAKRVGLIGRMWVMLTAVLGLFEFFNDFTGMPPRIILGILPPLAFVLWLTRSPFIKKILPTLPILALYFMQFFRVIVEFALYELWKIQLIPQAMTFAGRNFDIVIGVSAPIVGFLVYRAKALPPKFAFFWNILGLLVLTNVVVTGILSAPTAFRVLFEDYPNTAVGQFPFMWLPLVLVPIAYSLHILAIRYYFLTKNKK